MTFISNSQLSSTSSAPVTLPPPPIVRFTQSEIYEGHVWEHITGFNPIGGLVSILLTRLHTADKINDPVLPTKISIPPFGLKQAVDNALAGISPLEPLSHMKNFRPLLKLDELIHSAGEFCDGTKALLDASVHELGLLAFFSAGHCTHTGVFEMLKHSDRFHLIRRDQLGTGFILACQRGHNGFIDAFLESNQFDNKIYPEDINRGLALLDDPTCTHVIEKLYTHNQMYEVPPDHFKRASLYAAKTGNANFFQTVESRNKSDMLLPDDFKSVLLTAEENGHMNVVNILKAWKQSE